MERPVLSLWLLFGLPACLITAQDHAAWMDRDGDGADGTEDCDDDDPRVGAKRAWYEDLDGDGWGTEASRPACNRPDGHGPYPGDCDDRDATVHPGSLDWVDGVDGNCNGYADDANVSGAALRLEGERAGDAAGAGLSGAGDVDGDGVADLVAGAWGWDAPDAQDAGAAWVVLGSAVNLPTGTRSLTRMDAALQSPAAGTWAGAPLAPVGDTDDDGYGEVLVGVAWPASGETGAGVAWLVPGPMEGTLDLASASQALLVGDARDDFAALSAAGDQDGDDLPDLWVGLPFLDGTAEDAGGACLVGGRATGTVVVTDGPCVRGGATGDYAGAAVAGGGDLDGDGQADLAVSAPWADAGAEDRGTVWVLPGPLERDVDLSTISAAWSGRPGDQTTGYALAMAPDLDADGYDDLLAGIPWASGRVPWSGAAVVLPGSARLTLAEGARITGETESEAAGTSVAGLGDLDGDGWGDLAVGAPEWDERGRVGIFFGPMGGTWTVGEAWATVQGPDVADTLGTTVAGPGDVNDDGLADLLVGAPQARANGRAVGVVWLFYGSPW